jgi:hypothetical protein
MAVSLLYSFHFAHPAVAFRRSAFEAIGRFYREPETVFDIITEARLLCRGLLAYDPRIGAAFRVHGDNVSRSLDPERKRRLRSNRFKHVLLNPGAGPARAPGDRLGEAVAEEPALPALALASPRRAGRSEEDAPIPMAPPAAPPRFRGRDADLELDGLISRRRQVLDAGQPRLGARLPLTGRPHPACAPP